jgi:hypothetical protein
VEFAEGFAPTNRETIWSGPELAGTCAVLRAWCVRAGPAGDGVDLLADERFKQSADIHFGRHGTDYRSGAYKGE